MLRVLQCSGQSARRKECPMPHITFKYLSGHPPQGKDLFIILGTRAWFSFRLKTKYFVFYTQFYSNTIIVWVEGKLYFILFEYSAFWNFRSHAATLQNSSCGPVLTCSILCMVILHIRASTWLFPPVISFSPVPVLTDGNTYSKKYTFLVFFSLILNSGHYVYYFIVYIGRPYYL